MGVGRRGGERGKNSRGGAMRERKREGGVNEIEERVERLRIRDC